MYNPIQEEIIFLNDLPVLFSRKEVKNINLRIDRQGKVKLSAPILCPIKKIMLFLYEKEPWIRKHVSKEVSHGSLEKEQQQQYRSQMQSIIPALIKKWEPIIGVNVSTWRIKSMVSRWGSCNVVSKSICLNLHLSKKPIICLEYVLVHEMVHLLEPSHNRRFYMFMNNFMPEWKLYKRILNEKMEFSFA